ncbi:unnamed protein product [Rhizophagus irregularis]|uniref:glycerol kinase n=1 Tax=Rhizophagus irregularis TaxID=588596 RepID=A0A916E9S8_9GLOM|nr:unnamed protein product [Rhizophagus irregularis]
MVAVLCGHAAEQQEPPAQRQGDRAFLQRRRDDQADRSVRQIRPAMFLGIDIGTSGVKAVVLDTHGVVVGQGTAALSVQRPHPLWSEQDPEDWWKATSAAVLAIDPAVRRAVRGIGLAGQMHGATLLGADDRPLRPAILWNDGRSFAECAALEATTPEFRTLGGNIVMPGFTAPKLEWVRRQEPEVFAQVATVLLPKDYVRLRMTGEKASDMSDSAGTLWLDVAGRRWSDTLLAACGLTQAQMPRLVEGTDVAGMLRADIAEAWGISQVPVAGGAGDNAGGAAGVGVVTDGKALLSLGGAGRRGVRARRRARRAARGGGRGRRTRRDRRWRALALLGRDARRRDGGALGVSPGRRGRPRAGGRTSRADRGRWRHSRRSVRCSASVAPHCPQCRADGAARA